MKTDRLGSLFEVVRAYGILIYFDLYLARNDFAALHDKIRTFPVAHRKPDLEAVPRLCRAVDIACICYMKQVLCLQRSAATTCLLRRFGVPARTLIGVQQFPFKAHAWVEVDGRVVNDKAYARDIYAVLDCC